HQCIGVGNVGQWLKREIHAREHSGWKGKCKG
ncbi:MAG: hypothetical protein ACI8Z5_002160, partial [Lentimonas sp.]